MERVKIDILGLAETRWRNSGTIQFGDYTFLYSGNEKRSERGVALLINKKNSKSLKGYWPISDRVLCARLKGHPTDTFIIQVYAPTPGSSDEEIEKFYEEVNIALSKSKHREVKLVMGDWNAKVGLNNKSKACGMFGLGEGNDRGEDFTNWCEQNRLIITNTCFKNRDSRLYTWRSPGDRTQNQIDYICVNSRMRNSVLDCKTYPSADCGSDHQLLVACVRTCFKKTHKGEVRMRHDYEAVNTETMKNMQKAAKTLWTERQSSEKSTWETYKEICNNIKREFVPKKKNNRQTWMTEKILETMEERRKMKRNTEKYQILDKRVREMCMQSKIEFFEKKCQEIEKLKIISPKECHQNIKEVVGKRWKNRNDGNVIKDKKGRILLDKDDIMKRWEEYIKDLYGDENRDRETIKFEGHLTGEIILKDEIRRAMKSMKRGKAVGNDQIAVELLMYLGDTGVDILERLFNEMYNDGDIVDELLESTFIPTPKKPKAIECGNYRTISVMSHTTKLLLKVLLNRLKSSIHQEINECQYGFMPDKGTRNAVFVLKNLAERCIEVNKNLYCCFIDFTKAFDRVQHNILFELLSDLEFQDRDLRLVQHLYFKQKANIRLKDQLSNFVEIARGVRQGCVMSPDLFSLYSEVILRSIDTLEGVKIGGVNINNIRFADDTVLIAESEKSLQKLLDAVQKECENFEMQINVQKTEVMVFSKKKQPPKIKVSLNGEILKQVNQFKYLGSIMTSDAKSTVDIKCRIAVAKNAFIEMKAILTNLKMPFQLRYRILKCYITPILLYGSENWTLNKTDIRKIKAAEMWFLRRMEKVKWTEKITNEEVLNKTIQNSNIMSDISKR